MQDILIPLYQLHIVENLKVNLQSSTNKEHLKLQNMVEKLSKYTSLKGRNISFDRLYTTIPLADWVLEKDITSVGTLVANRRGLSKEFIKTAEREEFSYKVLWRKDEPHIPLHSYVVKTKSTGKRNVLLLSTLEPLLAVTRDDGKKPP